jgi:hypothetical protein
MANYIMKIFRAYAMVVFSWGFNAPTAIANGLRFKVQGFKFKGTVEVEYNEGIDLFDIRLIQNGKVVETIEDVYLDSLVDVIDNHVEKVDNYKQRVINTYAIGI